jgi:hypothetical protein
MSEVVLHGGIPDAALHLSAPFHGRFRTEIWQVGDFWLSFWHLRRVMRR